ncbi:DNA polymerase III subunit delta [Hydrotalea sandarakina]|jgi:DNA polymerase-3 subunit delta|uniref:DNA polymerase III delta subunit n=1 Tax=Hydrotalea sandarakina TaxID=1004304 RepID=A0A2W7RXM6_9BACT|nr:DNA polymerase III subunit delta [Hydrotalea sandarakina]PZX65518.1 DNA polymerase III delta subunit [Hydrotalea sandarakina]
MSYEKILADWQKKVFKPIYWLEGEETYYIDHLMQYAESNLLSETEKEFNLTILYGRDTDWAQLINACRRYPMFADKQVVLLKEAQQMKDIEKLEAYIENPSNTTILIIGYKEKKLDGRLKLAKLLKQKHELLTTRRLYENELPAWVKQTAQSLGYSIQPKALGLLVDAIGNDLSRLYNEIEKLTLNLKGKKEITDDDVETYVGISKEFNVFELQSAIAHKNMAKAIKIIQYFDANPKAGPLQLVLPAIHNFFCRVLMLHAEGSSKNPVTIIGSNHPTAIADHMAAVKNYSHQKTQQILLLLHEYNLKSIGINDAGSSAADLLKELTAKIIF